MAPATGRLFFCFQFPMQTSKRQAESSLNKENIPAAYKQQVRDYFNSIKP